MPAAVDLSQGRFGRSARAVVPSAALAAQLLSEEQASADQSATASPSEAEDDLAGPVAPIGAQVAEPLTGEAGVLQLSNPQPAEAYQHGRDTGNTAAIFGRAGTTVVTQRRPAQGQFAVAPFQINHDASSDDDSRDGDRSATSGVGGPGSGPDSDDADDSDDSFSDDSDDSGDSGDSFSDDSDFSDPRRAKRP